MNSFARILFIFLLSTFAFSNLSHNANTSFQQNLLFQAIIIGVLSSSGLVRGLSVDIENKYNVSFFIINFTFFWLISSGIALLFGNFYDLDGVKFSLIIGGSFSAFVGTMSGLIAKDHSAFKAFFSQVINYSIGCIIVLLIIQGVIDFSHDLAFLVVFFQVSIFAFFLLHNFCYFKNIIKIKSHISLKKVITFLLVGIFNSSLLVLFYIYRENWLVLNNSDASSFAFYLLRISDLVLQFYVVFLSIYFVLVWDFFKKYLVNISVLIVILNVIVLYLFSLYKFNTSYTVFIILIQFTVDMVRYFASLAFVSSMRSNDNYLSSLILGTPVFVLFIFIFCFNFFDFVGLYLMYSLSSITQLLVFLFLYKRYLNYV